MLPPNCRDSVGTRLALEICRDSAGTRDRPRSAGTRDRAEFLDRTWGQGSLDVSERAVNNVILRLRRKLDAPGLIRTVRGTGFGLDDRA